MKMGISMKLKTKNKKIDIDIKSGGTKIQQFAKANNLTKKEIAELHDFIASGDMEKYEGYTHKPVGIRRFITSSEFMNVDEVIWDTVMDEIEELNSGAYYEAVLTGAIGVAKTTIALYTTAYQLYLLSCMKAPHKTFNLDPASEILLIFQNITKDLAEGVDYQRFREMIKAAPYFQRHFQWQKGIKSELRFPHRIVIKPVSGAETATIGQNVMGGIIDEMNFMAVTEKSKLSKDGSGKYDQAVSLYASISRRRKTRFMQQGKLPGILCLVSSKRYPGQFTDTKEEEAKQELAETGSTGIFLYDKRTWEIMPTGTFLGEWFHIFIGDISRKPFIIDPKVTKKESLEEHLVMAIPTEFRSDFQTDMGDSLRDIAGVSTLASMPFIMNVDILHEAFHEDQPSIFNVQLCDFETKKVGLHKKRVLMADAQYPRFAHVDLGLTSDHAGLSIGHVNKFVAIELDGQKVQMPNIVIDGHLRVAPPPNNEINFEKIRKIFYMLANMGFPLRWVTFDSWQSVDSMQLLRAKGFSTGTQSIDRDTIPYETTKTAILQGRLHIQADPWVQMEFARLERTDKGKIDHPAGGSKDVTDAIAGVTYGLTMQNYIWVSFGVQPNPALIGDLYNLDYASDSKRHNY